MRANFVATVCLLILAALTPVPAAQAQPVGQVVSVGGSSALLIRPPSVRGSVILMAGGDGRLLLGPSGEVQSLINNSVVRTRGSFVAQGYAALVVDANIDLRQAVAYMGKVGRPVIVVATSRGTQRAAQGIAAGARPDRLVLTSGFYSDASGGRINMMSVLRDPSRLPPTVLIHHRQDGCRLTSPDGVELFLRWAGSRARVVWLDGGYSAGDPCGARSYHGFLGIEDQMVEAALGAR